MFPATKKRAISGDQSAVILVVAAQPFLRVVETAFVASLGYEVEIVIRAVQHVDPPRVGRISAKDLAGLVLCENTRRGTRCPISSASVGKGARAEVT